MILLTHIVNLSLSTGQFPDSCKLAVVSPIFKGGDANDPNDYRPISILPLVSKCIENCVNVTLKVTNFSIFINIDLGKIILLLISL